MFAQLLLKMDEECYCFSAFAADKLDADGAIPNECKPEIATNLQFLFSCQDKYFHLKKIYINCRVNHAPDGLICDCCKKEIFYYSASFVFTKRDLIKIGILYRASIQLFKRLSLCDCTRIHIVRRPFRGMCDACDALFPSLRKALQKNATIVQFISEMHIHLCEVMLVTICGKMIPS